MNPMLGNKIEKFLTKRHHIDRFQRNLDRLEHWRKISVVEFNKSKCWILHLGWSNTRHRHKLGEEGLQSSSADRDLGVPVSSSPPEASSVPWQPGGQTPSWGASNTAQPAEHRR